MEAFLVSTGLVALVVAGTTVGMMLANVPAVLLGDRMANRIPVRLAHGIAAVIFAMPGIATLTRFDQWFSA